MQKNVSSFVNITAFTIFWTPFQSSAYTIVGHVDATIDRIRSKFNQHHTKMAEHSSW